MGDYPLRADKESLFRLADVFRRIQPHFVLTHSLADPYNYDHPLAANLAQEARIIAQAEGYRPGEAIIGAPPVYCFEPHQPEQCGWKPDVLLDITSVWEKNMRLFNAWPVRNICGNTTREWRYNVGYKQTQHRHCQYQDHYSWRRLSKPLPSRHGGSVMSLVNMKGVVVTNIERAELALLQRFAEYGVATVHEAQLRQGLLDERIKPIQQGRCIAGNAVTVLVTPGDNWMFHVAVEQCQPGDVLLVAPTSECHDGFLVTCSRPHCWRAAWWHWLEISGSEIARRCAK